MSIDSWSSIMKNLSDSKGDRDVRALIWSLSVLLVAILVVVVLEVGFVSYEKVDISKQVMSPWDVSAAPPQFMHKSAVKVKSNTVVAKNATGKPNVNAVASGKTTETQARVAMDVQ